jgi:hypothetical protein
MVGGRRLPLVGDNQEVENDESQDRTGGIGRRADGLKLSLKLYHARKLLLNYQQLMTGSTVDSRHVQKTLLGLHRPNHPRDLQISEGTSGPPLSDWLTIG